MRSSSFVSLFYYCCACCSVAVAVALMSACDAAPEPVGSDSELLSAYSLALAPSQTRVAGLSWGSPDDPACPWVYRVRVAEDMPEQLARVTRRPPERSEHLLVLGRAPGSKDGVPGGALPERAVFSGRLAFSGPRTKDRPLRREWFLSRSQIGPASPDAACQERTWDPVEDALALGWPRLPGRVTAVGERWTGTRVESRCNRLACYSPELNRGGIDADTPPCVTMSWAERLRELLVLADGTHVAVITSEWNDGHPEGVGVSSQRTAVVELSTGRLLRAEVEIHHTILGVERRLEIDAVDACPGGLVAAGWQREADVTSAVEAASSVYADPRAHRRSASKNKNNKQRGGGATRPIVTPRPIPPMVVPAPSPSPSPASSEDAVAKPPVITTPAPSPAGDGAGAETPADVDSGVSAEDAASAPRQEQDNG